MSILEEELSNLTEEIKESFIEEVALKLKFEG